MKPSQPIELPDIYRGCNYPPIFFEWKDPDGEPFDLTGWIAYAFTERFNLNALVSNPLLGVSGISMRPEHTTPLRLGVYHWDWIWVGEGLTYPPVLCGTVTVKNPKSTTT